MAYKALYRRFRPRRFCELKGQDNISTVLKNQIMSGQTSHAYLFSGPRGTGKTSTAKILACALNCTNLQDGEPCLECENCKAALSDSMPDIIEMDAASNNSVDNAREIRDKVSLLPVKGKHKVYIIDEVHMLSNSAFNALLKTIEEPPEYSVFILATTELRKLPKTVLSRCQRFDFKSIADNSIMDRMKEVLSNIGASATDDSLYAIAEASEGGMRDALSILDKCCSVSENITEKTVSEVLNLTDMGAIRDLVKHILNYHEKDALLLLNRLTDEGADPSNIIGQLIAEFRSLLIDSVVSKDSDQAKAKLLRNIEILSDAEVKMKLAVRPSVILETAIMRILLPEASLSAEDMASRIDKLEHKLENAVKNGFDLTSQAMDVLKTEEIEQKTAKTSSAKKAKQQKQQIEKKISANDESFWKEVLNYYHEKDPAWYTFLKDIKLVEVSEGRIVLTGEPSKLRIISEGLVLDKLKEVILKLTGVPSSIEILIPEEESEPDILEGVEILD